MNKYFETKITIGTILELITLLVIVVFWGARIEAHQATMKVDINRHLQEVEVLKRQYVQADVYDAERQRLNERWEEIKERLKRIEAALDKP
jgi:uncharacterized membrane protein